MKTSFDWKTEEKGWPQQSAANGSLPSNGRNRGLMLLFLALLALVALSVAAWVQHRHDGTVRQLEHDLLLALELQRTAAADGDGELFGATLSTEEPSWERIQLRLLEANLLQDRPPFGLKARIDEKASPQIILSPDLMNADLSWTQSYEVTTNPGHQTRLDLQQSGSFRREAGQWVSVPPDDSHWGDWQAVQGRLVTLSFRQRDQEWIEDLLIMIDKYMGRLCDQEEPLPDNCAGDTRWQIRFDDDPRSLLALEQPGAGRPSQFDYDYPAPGLVGTPLDENARDEYLEIYSKPLLQQMTHSFEAARAYPRQAIVGLCFAPTLRGRRAYRYDLQRNSWQALLEEETFRNMNVTPDDTAVFLAGDSGLFLSADGRELRQLHGPVPPIAAQDFLGWISAQQSAAQLIRRPTGDSTQFTYGMLDLAECALNRCELTDLPGFPVWADDGDGTLFQDGSQIAAGSRDGAINRSLGKGFSPFWLENGMFGFVRFAALTAEGDLTTQIVIGRAGEQALWDVLEGTDLAQAAGLEEGERLFVNAAVRNPADPDLLLIAATGIKRYAGRYFIFSADLTADKGYPPQPRPKLEIDREGTLGSVPGLLTPTGPPPFAFSDDGRWLALTELRGSHAEGWTVIIHDLWTGNTSQLDETVPAMPANFPLLDWSSDGNWLVVADRNSLHLIAPDLNHKVKVSHNFDACTHIGWVD